MYPLLILIALLVFPALEIAILFQLAHVVGLWLILVLAIPAFIGMLLLKGARFSLMSDMLSAMQRGASPLQAVFSTGRLMLAGALFIFPGIISDAIAILLLLPSFGIRRRARASVAPSGVIEGRYRREP